MTFSVKFIPKVGGCQVFDHAAATLMLHGVDRQAGLPAQSLDMGRSTIAIGVSPSCL